MGVHCSTISRTMLLLESLCELCISFPEAKIALNGLEERGWTPRRNIDRKCVVISGGKLAFCNDVR